MRTLFAFATMLFLMFVGAPARAEEAAAAFDRFANGFGVPQGMLAHDGAEWTHDGVLFVRNLRIPVSANAATPINLISDIPLGDLRISNITYTGEVPSGFSVSSTGAVIDFAALTQRASAVLSDPAVDPNAKISAQMFQNMAAGVILFGYAQIPVAMSFDVTYDEEGRRSAGQGTLEFGNAVHFAFTYGLGNVTAEVFALQQKMMRTTMEALSTFDMMQFLAANAATYEALSNPAYANMTYERLSLAISERGLFTRLKPMIDASIAQSTGRPAGTPVPEEKIAEAIQSLAQNFQTTPEAVEPIVRAGLAFFARPGTLSLDLTFDPPVSITKFMELASPQFPAPGQPPANPFARFAEFTHLTVEYTAPQ